MYKSHALPGRVQHRGFFYAYLSNILNVSHGSFGSNKRYRRNKRLQANGFLAFRKKRESLMKNTLQAKKQSPVHILKYFLQKWQKGKCRFFYGKCKSVNDQCFKQNIPIRWWFISITSEKEVIDNLIPHIHYPNHYCQKVY